MTKLIIIVLKLDFMEQKRVFVLIYCHILKSSI